MEALPSLQQLRYLSALAGRLHFGRAAEDCRVSQSTLSAGLQELERLLGARLVERSRRGVALTPAGQRVLGRARELLAGAGGLGALARQDADPMKGRLRLGLIPTLAPYLLPRLLPWLKRRCPALDLAVREERTAGLLERLEQRSLDFALIALPYEAPGLRQRLLFDDELCLVGRRGDPLLKQRGAGLAQKAGERLLLLEEGHCLREHSLRACGRRESANADGLEASSLPTLVQMAEHGLGLALLPRLALDAGLLEGTHLQARSLGRPEPKRGVALLMRPGSPAAPAFDRMAEAILHCRPASEKRRVSG